MSQLRQPQIFDDRYVMRSLAVNYADRERLPPHRHPWAQLVYAESGVMQVDAGDAAWLVPTTRAIWIPPGIEHGIEMRGNVSMRTLYVAVVDEAWPQSCRGVEVTALLRELILYLVRIDKLEAGDPRHERLVRLLADLLLESGEVPLVLPMPADVRARRLAEEILARPENHESLETLARHTGASMRTLQRIFANETGVPLELWRLRARMQQAVVMLSAGTSVTDTALAAGYRSQSAFAATFKRVFGMTPSRYRRQLRS